MSSHPLKTYDPDQAPYRSPRYPISPVNQVREAHLLLLALGLDSQNVSRGVRYVLWDATGRHKDYSPPAWRNRATEEQKRVGWEMAVRIEKILCTVLYEAHKRQVEETRDTLSEGTEGFYKSYLD